MLYRFIVFILFVFLGCKKDLISSRIEGVVYGTTSKKPIGGASIDLVSSSDNRLQYIKTVYTDEFGNFEIPKFKRDSRKTYHLYCQHPDYLDIKYFPIKEKIFKEKFEFDLQEPGFINLHVKNVSPYDSNDTFIAETGFYGNGNPIIYIEKENVDTIIKGLKVRAVPNLRVGFTIMKNGLDKFIKKDISPTPFDTLELYIEY